MSASYLRSAHARASDAASSRDCVCALDLLKEHAPQPLPPHAAKGAERLPLVSVLCPTTFERHWAHSSLYRCFDSQTHPCKELIVLDTGASPSPFFSALDDPRVHYTHLPSDADMDTLQAFAEAELHPPGGLQTPQWAAAWQPCRERLEALRSEHTAVAQQQAADGPNSR